MVSYFSLLVLGVVGDEGSGSLGGEDDGSESGSLPEQKRWAE